MIKLHAAFSKKIPAEVEYSSKSFHAALELEVADDLARDGPKLQEKLRALWADLERAVEAQIRASNGKASNGPSGTSGPRRAGDAPDGGRASPKQLNYVQLLAKRARRWGLPDLEAHVRQRFGVGGIYDLSKADASMLIEEMSAEAPEGSSSGRRGRR